jgi:hypothetical protein
MRVWQAGAGGRLVKSVRRGDRSLCSAIAAVLIKASLGTMELIVAVCQAAGLGRFCLAGDGRRYADRANVSHLEAIGLAQLQHTWRLQRRDRRKKCSERQKSPQIALIL